MKYSILGFNQEKIINYNKDGLKCDLTDLLLLNYIIYAQTNPKMKHVMDENNQPCVWLYHAHILNDLPILNITDGTLKNRLTKLRKMELITSKTVANENSQGSRTYYRTTSLLYDMLFETTSFKNDMIDEPRHSKMTSDTFTNSNTKVNKVLSKDNTTEFLGSAKKKPKKESLYTKCLNLVDDFISQHNCGNPVRKKLVDYLNYRISVKEKPLYTNIWKSILSKLDSLHKEGYTYERIIDYNLERGYLSFYAPTKYYVKSKLNESGARNVPRMTKEDYEEEEKHLAELKAKGIQVTF